MHNYTFRNLREIEIESNGTYILHSEKEFHFYVLMKIDLFQQ